MKIVKIIQWDMGHRVLNHRSVCKGLHGHRYKAEICVSGNVVSEHGVSEEGMVVDFADIKKISKKIITVLGGPYFAKNDKIWLRKFLNRCICHCS